MGSATVCGPAQHLADAAAREREVEPVRGARLQREECEAQRALALPAAVVCGRARIERSDLQAALLILSYLILSYLIGPAH